LNGYNITKLSNGINIVTENIPYVKSFSLGFWFNTGSRNENISNNGISHFIEHMLFKGTEKRSAKKIADDIESLGGYLNAFTSKEHTCFYGRGLSQHLTKTFEVLADMIQNSVFRQRDIEKEAQVIMDELYDIEDSPEELIFDKFESIIYSGSKYQFPIIGTEKNILNFTSDSITSYMSGNYVFNNFYIIASGAVDHNKIVHLVEKYLIKDFGKKRNGKINLPDNPAADQFFEKETQQTHVIIGKKTFGYKDNRRKAISLLSHILGEGSSSRLFQALRERNGITYQVNSFFNSFYEVSTFGAYFSTNDKTAQKAVDIVYQEIEKLRNRGVTAKELDKAKEYIKGSILMGLESTTNRMLRMAQSIIYFDRVKLVDESISEINAVSMDEIADLSQNLLNTDTFVKTVISSKNTLFISAA